MTSHEPPDEALTAPSQFARVEAGLIHASLSPAAWADLVTRRPELEAALAARTADLAAAEKAPDRT